jgi:hypothetical protein
MRKQAAYVESFQKDKHMALDRNFITIEEPCY